MNNISISKIIEKTDLGVLKEKNIQLLEYYKDEAHKTLRYMFGGQLVPLQVQDIIVYLTRNSTLKPGEKTTIKQNKVITILEKHQKLGNTDTSYLIQDHEGKKHHIQIQLTSDLEGGKFPARTFHYDDKIFKQVPLNGNVYSHSIHQQDHIESCTNIDKKAGIITPLQADLLLAFNPKHDLPEILSGDEQDGVKEAGKYEDEVKDLDQLFHNFKNKPHTKNDIILLKHIASYFDGDEKVHNGKQTLFKLYERINYLNDAFNIFKNPEFFNHQHLFAGCTIGNGISGTFTKNIPTKLPTEGLENNTSTEKVIPTLELPVVKTFFQKNKEKIDHILTTCAQDTNKHPDLLKRDFTRHLQDRENLKTTLGIS